VCVNNVINIDGKDYKLITISGRSKYIAKDGSAINPIRRKQKCTMHLSKDGYPCFGGGIPVHLYVAKAWVDGYFDGAEVNHKDFDRTNYNADNLEWRTHVDNVHYSSEADRYAHQIGEKNPNYHNNTLKNKLDKNPELKKIYYSRPGSQNGRAYPIDVYTKDMCIIKSFQTIKECATWICKITNKTLDKIPHVQSAISCAIKNNKLYKGYYFIKH
jgi:hypothetical protein